MRVPEEWEGVRVTGESLAPGWVQGNILGIGELPPPLLTNCSLVLGSSEFLLYSQQPRESDPFC